MATKYVETKTDEAGYNAMVEDITNAFSWDDITSSGSVTVFKKFNGGEDYVAFLVTKKSGQRPDFQIRRSKDGYIATTELESRATAYVAYAYGDGFLAMCFSANAFPTEGPYSYSSYACVTRCTNLINGDNGYCVFMAGYESTPTWYSKHSTSNTNVPYSSAENVNIGIAHPFHDMISGDVADSSILRLRALPDKLAACLTPVNFNGQSYTRMGRLLVATS